MKLATVISWDPDGDKIIRPRGSRAPIRVTMHASNQVFEEGDTVVLEYINQRAVVLGGVSSGDSGPHDHDHDDEYAPTPHGNDHHSVDYAPATHGHVGDYARMAWGSYNGDDATTRTITIGYRPRFVHIIAQGAPAAVAATIDDGTASGVFGWMRMADSSLAIGSGNTHRPRPTAQGFAVSHTTDSNLRSLNASGTTYRYIAIG